MSQTKNKIKVVEVDKLPEDIEDAHCQLVRRIHCMNRITHKVESKDVDDHSLNSMDAIEILSNEDLE